MENDKATNGPQQQPTYSWSAPGNYPSASSRPPAPPAHADQASEEAGARQGGEVGGSHWGGEQQTHQATPNQGQPGHGSNEQTEQLAAQQGPYRRPMAGPYALGASSTAPVGTNAPAAHPYATASLGSQSGTSTGSRHPGSANAFAAPAPLGGPGNPNGPGNTNPPGNANGPSGPGMAPKPKKNARKPRPWLMVSAAALIAAVLASGGTAFVMNNGGVVSSDSLIQVPQTTTTVANNSDGSPNWEAVAANVRQSVVAIDVKTQQGGAAGSGVIINAEKGYVLTNNHVVDGAQQIQVALADGRIYPAKKLGVDPSTDLAVIALANPPSDLQQATLGKSDDLKVGENVMAVGNPLGLDSTVTTGIVSALNRPVATTDEFSREQVVTNAIQIDAAINPGNSGGPLFDSSGHVIGITSSIATTSQSSGSIGLGFAIPIDLATNIANQLIDHGSAEHAYLGVTLTNGSAKVDGAIRVGAQIHEVVSNTPAARAGLKSGDIIVGIDGHEVGGAESLTGYVRTYSAGEKATLDVIRQGKEVKVTATLATSGAMES